VSVRFSARARVRVLLELDAGSSWGGEVSVEQIREQAHRAVVARIKTGAIGDEAVLLNDPVVDIVIVTEER
jgi:hypothetical protein